MNWKDILHNWKNGIFHTYPKRYEGTEKRFQWNTSVLKNNGNTIFKEKYKMNNKLPKKQNYKAFKEHIKKSNNKYVTTFPNLNGDTILIVPIPRPGKNYATLKDFVDNAPKIQQKEFWKKVAQVSKKQMKKFESVWVSAHGLGVPYLHIRVCSMPKYYFDKELSKKIYPSKKIINRKKVINYSKKKGFTKQIGRGKYYIVEIDGEHRKIIKYIDNKDIRNIGWQGNKRLREPRRERVENIMKNMGYKMSNLTNLEIRRNFKYTAENGTPKSFKLQKLKELNNWERSKIKDMRKFLKENMGLSEDMKLNNYVNILLKEVGYIEEIRLYIDFFKKIFSIIDDKNIPNGMNKVSFILLLITKIKKFNIPITNTHTPSGASGIYHKINDHEGIKKFNFEYSVGKVQDILLIKMCNELKMFCIERNDHLIEYKHWFFSKITGQWENDQCNLCIVMENGEPLIKENKFITSVIEPRLAVLIKIVKSVEFLHDKGFVHMDLKPLNIVRVGEKYKLIDFDGILPINNKGRILTTTLEYMNCSIHTAREETYNKVDYDIYSIGIIIWQIYFDKYPLFSNVNDNGLYIKKKKLYDGKSIIKSNGSIINSNESRINNNGSIINSKELRNEPNIPDLIMRCIGPIGDRPNISEIIEKLEELEELERK